MLILAIDLGHSKSVFCLFETTTGEAEFGPVATCRAALQKLLEQKRPARAVIEISPLAGWVHDLVESLGIEIPVADPTQASPSTTAASRLGIEIPVADPTQDAWKWKNVKRKTDEDDALKLARLSALGQLNLVHIPDPPMRQWRRLIPERVTRVAEQTRCKNRIRALRLSQEQTWLAGKNGWTKKAIAGLEQLSRPFAECPAECSDSLKRDRIPGSNAVSNRDFEPKTLRAKRARYCEALQEELWRGILHTELQRLGHTAALLKTVADKLDELATGDRNAQLLQSIPGVGPRTAEVGVTALDHPHRFRRGRQVAGYAGLTPRRWQSSTMDRPGRISKRGSRTLRRGLNQAAGMAVRYNPWAQAVFTRSTGGQKERAKMAIVAVMRKLRVVAWAMLRDPQRYRCPARMPQTVAAG